MWLEVFGVWLEACGVWLEVVAGKNQPVSLLQVSRDVEGGGDN